MSAVTELTDDELLAHLAKLPKRSRTKITTWILTEVKRTQRPAKKRGPRAKAHAKDRQIARLWAIYKAAHLQARKDAKFAATLPADLRPKVKGDPSNSLARSIKHGRDLNRQRPALRRLVAALKDRGGLISIGKLGAAEVRDTIKAARDPRIVGDAEIDAEIERRAVEQEALNAAATRVLLGDAGGSFISLPPQK